ncbi:MAG: hypothetical protein RLZZ522_2114 [Verrucomicrobiota bacterium]|jgi:predicted small secreted protein
MKRIVLMAAMLVSVGFATSCGTVNGLTQSAGRLVQAAGRTVGL